MNDKRLTPEQHAEATRMAQDAIGRRRMPNGREASYICNALLDLDRQCREIRTVCGEAYQLAGAVRAPQRVLDNLSDASCGTPLQHETFLPVLDTDCEIVAEQVAELIAERTEVAEQAKRIEELEQFEHDAVDRIDLRMAEIDRLRKALEQALSRFSGEYIHTLTMNEVWVMGHLRAALSAAPPPVPNVAERAEKEREG